MRFKPSKNIAAHERAAIPLSKVITNTRYLSEVIKIVENWGDVVALRLGAKESITMKLRSGRSVQVRGIKGLIAFWMGVEGQRELLNLELKKRHLSIKVQKGRVYFPYRGRRIVLFYDSDRMLANIFFLIREQFLKEQYGWLDVENRDVVDIGANIADSSIFFALSGARKVYAYEPYPHSYDIAAKNVRLNSFEDKVKVMNEAVGGKAGFIRVDAGYESMSNSAMREKRSGKRIPRTSLQQIVRKFGLRDAVLKMDCEGSEYEILLDSDTDTLRSFTQIMIEYHHGYLNLKEKLNNAGFELRHTMPNLDVDAKASPEGLFSGLIFATRR